MYNGGPYDPIDPNIIPLIPFYVILVTVSMFLGFRLIIKGNRKKKKSPKLLGISFISYSSGVLCALIGLIEVVIYQEFRELYRLSLPIGYTIAMIGNIFLILFVQEIFKIQKRIKIFFMLLFISTIVILNLNENWYGVPREVYEGKFSLRMYSSLLMMISSMSLYFYIINSIIRSKSYRNFTSIGFLVIIWSFVCFILFWVCMAIDAIIIFIKGGGYSIFVFIAWIFGLLFWIFSYLGLIMPKWFRKIVWKLSNQEPITNEGINK